MTRCDHWLVTSVSNARCKRLISVGSDAVAGVVWLVVWCGVFKWEITRIWYAPWCIALRCANKPMKVESLRVELIDWGFVCGCAHKRIIGCPGCDCVIKAGCLDGSVICIVQQVVLYNDAVRWLYSVYLLLMCA